MFLYLDCLHRNESYFRTSALFFKYVLYLLFIDEQREPSKRALTGELYGKVVLPHMAISVIYVSINLYGYALYFYP